MPERGEGARCGARGPPSERLGFEEEGDGGSGSISRNAYLLVRHRERAGLLEKRVKRGRSCKDGERREEEISRTEKTLWWGACRYVLIRFSVSGADSRQLYVVLSAFNTIKKRFCRSISPFHAASPFGLVQCGVTAFQAKRLHPGLLAIPRCRDVPPPSSLGARTTVAPDWSRGPHPLPCC